MDSTDDQHDAIAALDLWTDVRLKLSLHHRR
jgi:hypothetical protein